MTAARICKYRFCDVDLDEVDKRPNADYCTTDHKEAERRLKRREAAGHRVPGGKPRKSARTASSRRIRRGSGRSLHLLPREGAYIRSLLRGEKRPALTRTERQHLRAKVDRVVERLGS